MGFDFASFEALGRAFLRVIVLMAGLAVVHPVRSWKLELRARGTVAETGRKGKA
jgi:hypothetical protein